MSWRSMSCASDPKACVLNPGLAFILLVPNRQGRNDPKINHPTGGFLQGNRQVESPDSLLSASKLLAWEENQKEENATSFWGGQGVP